MSGLYSMPRALVPRFAAVMTRRPWRLPEGDLVLKQSFQMVSGTLKSGAKTVPITNGRLSGDQLSFTAGNARYTGRVSGSIMQGTFKSSRNTANWSATRIGDVVQAPPK